MYRQESTGDGEVDHRGPSMRLCDHRFAVSTGTRLSSGIVSLSRPVYDPGGGGLPESQVGGTAAVYAVQDQVCVPGEGPRGPVVETPTPDPVSNDEDSGTRNPCGSLGAPRHRTVPTVASDVWVLRQSSDPCLHVRASSPEKRDVQKCVVFGGL